MSPTRSFLKRMAWVAAGLAACGGALALATALWPVEAPDAESREARHRAIPGVMLSRVELSEAFDPVEGAVRPGRAFAADTKELVLSFSWQSTAPARIDCGLSFGGRPLDDLCASVATGERPEGRGLFRLRAPPGGWPSGEYELSLSAGGVPLTVTRFAVE